MISMKDMGLKLFHIICDIFLFITFFILKMRSSVTFITVKIHQIDRLKHTIRKGFQSISAI